jgi:hypothetical protein
MVPFILTVEAENQSLTITVEQLERFADVDGYTRYDVTADGRRSVIYVNVTDDSPAVYAFDDADQFTPDECRNIGAAIRQYNNEARVVFAQFLLDF